MLTTMTEQDWKIVLQVFQASRSRRCDKGQDDRRFLEAQHSNSRRAGTRKIQLPEQIQTDLGRPALVEKISSFRRRANQFYQLAPSHPPGGALAIVTNAGWDAVDAAASARKCVHRAGLP
jgi:hypothetical protein